MEKIIEVPEGVSVQVNEKEVVVNGPKGEIKRNFSDPRFNSKYHIEKGDGRLVVKTDNDKRKIKAMVGTVASHINNMIVGVNKGFVYKLKIFYLHFPITVDVKGNKILIKNFLGERSVRSANVVGSVKVDVKKDMVTLTGINKEELGSTASNIEQACRLPKKDRRRFLDGIYLIGYEVGE